MKVNVNSLSETQLFPYIVSSLYAKINDAREIQRIPKLYYDTSAEKAIESFILNQKTTDQELEEYLNECVFVSKNKTIIRLSKQFKSSNNNQQIFDNFCCLIEENTMNKKMPLLDTNYTHIGINIHFESQSNQYFIMCIVSLKSICLEDTLLLKDGYIIIGRILSGSNLLNGARIMKNEKIGYEVGPKNIRVGNNNMTFCIYLPKLEYKDLCFRKIYLYLTALNVNVPYGNQSAGGNTVPFQQLELGLCQIVEFKKSKDFSKETIDNFINRGGIDNYGAGNAKVDKPIAIGNEQKKPPLQNKLSSLISRLSQGKNSQANNNKNNFLVSTPISKDGHQSALSQNANAKGNSTPMMSTIKEESFANLNQSFLNSNNKISISPLCKAKINEPPSSNFCLLNSNNNNNNQFNPIINNNNINNNNTNNNNINSRNNVTDLIGNRLQKAEMLVNNINATSISQPLSQNSQIDVNMKNGTTMNFPFGNNNSNNKNNQILNQIQNNNQNQNLNFNLNQNNNQVINDPFGNNNNNTLINHQNNNPNANFFPNMNNNLFNNINNNNNNNTLIPPPIQQQPPQMVFPQGQFFPNPPTDKLINPNLPNQFLQYNPIPQSNDINQNFQKPFNINDTYSQNQNNLPQIKLKPSTTVSVWQVIPNAIKFKSLLDVVGVGKNRIDQSPQLILSKDLKYCINLPYFCSGNMQSFVVNPQSKKDFIILLNKTLEKKEISKEDRYHFYHSNMKILIEDNYGSLKVLNDKPQEVKRFTISSIDSAKGEREYNSVSPLIKFKRPMREKQSFCNFDINNVINSNKENRFLYLSSESSKNKGNHSYLIDSYIFKDSLWNKTVQKNKQINKRNQSLSSSSFDDIDESLNQKILQNLIKKYLSPQEADKIYNYNSSYEELYKTRNFCDIILSIKGEEIPSHKIVLISQSPVFKEMIKQNEHRDNYITKAREIIKIVLPDSYNPKTFKEIFKWIYCGYIHEGLSIETLREMLMIADNLKIFPLQKILIVKHIIPNISKESALLFLKDTYKKITPKETSNAWSLLANFSLNCISKNSLILIKTHRTSFLSMDIDLLLKCIESSVYYLIEEGHLSLLLKLLIDKGYACDIFDLVIKISSQFKTCRNFSVQNIDLRPLFSTHSQSSPFDSDLITEESKASVKNSELKDSNSNSFSSIPPSAFSFGINDNNNISNEKNDNFTLEIKYCSYNLPASNSAPNIEYKKHKTPTFEFAFQIGKLNNTGMSVFSEVFSFGGRAWSVKVDISHNGDVSFYLIERGIPQKCINYNMGYSLSFTSLLCDFVVRDTSFEKSGIFFFSYSNNQNQIIGYQNFFNLKQLGKREVIDICIWLKEFTLHSACMQYLSDNFQTLFLNIKGNKSAKELSLLSNCIGESDKNFLHLSPQDVASIIYNDNLHVDNEDNVISALYIYCLNKEGNAIDPIMSAVRFEFVDFKVMCTLARDHDVIKNSHSFRVAFSKELNDRIKRLCIGRERKEWDNVLAMRRIGVKRKYYLSSVETSKLNITSELVSFFLDKNHHDGYIEKMKKLENYIDEEKKNFAKREEILERQNRELKMEMQRINERELKRRRVIEKEKEENERPNNSSKVKEIFASFCGIFKAK